MNYLPELTVRYKTYLKRALVEGLSDVFKNHIDEALQKTKITIDFPRTQASFPSVVIRFYESDIQNAGVGHYEIIEMDDGRYLKFKHYLYHGDLEFSIYALSSLDRDLISDTLVQIIAMGDLMSYTNRFLSRIYPDNAEATYPDALAHFININTDQIQGFGENTSTVPWAAEDDLLYTTSYRCMVYGEFYNPPPQTPLGFIEHVIEYPYINHLDPLPEGNPDDGSPWIPLNSLDNLLSDDTD